MIVAIPGARAWVHLKRLSGNFKPSRNAVAPHAHNEFLELLFELGLPGGLTALALFCRRRGRIGTKTFARFVAPAEQSNEAARWGLFGALSAAALWIFQCGRCSRASGGRCWRDAGRQSSPKPRASNGAWVVLMILIAWANGAGGTGFPNNQQPAHSGDFQGPALV